MYKFNLGGFFSGGYNNNNPAMRGETYGGIRYTPTQGPDLRGKLDPIGKVYEEAAKAGDLSEVGKKFEDISAHSNVGKEIAGMYQNDAAALQAKIAEDPVWVFSREGKQAIKRFKQRYLNDPLINQAKDVYEYNTAQLKKMSEEGTLGNIAVGKDGNTVFQLTPEGEVEPVHISQVGQGRLLTVDEYNTYFDRKGSIQGKGHLSYLNRLNAGHYRNYDEFRKYLNDNLKAIGHTSNKGEQFQGIHNLVGDNSSEVFGLIKANSGFKNNKSQLNAITNAIWQGMDARDKMAWYSNFQQEKGGFDKQQADNALKDYIASYIAGREVRESHSGIDARIINLEKEAAGAMGASIRNADKMGATASAIMGLNGEGQGKIIGEPKPGESGLEIVHSPVGSDAGFFNTKDPALKDKRVIPYTSTAVASFGRGMYTLDGKKLPEEWLGNIAVDQRNTGAEAIEHLFIDVGTNEIIRTKEQFENAKGIKVTSGIRANVFFNNDQSRWPFGLGEDEEDKPYGYKNLEHSGLADYGLTTDDFDALDDYLESGFDTDFFPGDEINTTEVIIPMAVPEGVYIDAYVTGTGSPIKTQQKNIDNARYGKAEPVLTQEEVYALFAKEKKALPFKEAGGKLNLKDRISILRENLYHLNFDD